MLRVLMNCAKRTFVRHATQVFSNLSNQELANPTLVKKLMTKRIAFHGRVSLVSLFHKKRVQHAVKVSFSEKKTKRYKKINVFKKRFVSQILGKKMLMRVSSKAYRCIKKAGSFDNYILTTHPKDLDSKLGEYLREMMLRKINDPEYRIPYILGTKKVPRLKNYRRYMWMKENTKLVVPKEYKKIFITLQRRFGSTVQQLNNKDYDKWLQLEKIKREQGDQMAPDHPLLLQINKKIGYQRDLKQEEAARQMGRKAREEFISHPTKGEVRKMRIEKTQKQYIIENEKIKQAWIKFQTTREE